MLLMPKGTRPMPMPTSAVYFNCQANIADDSTIRHRIILTYEAEAEEMTADAEVKRILDALPVP